MLAILCDDKGSELILSDCCAWNSALCAVIRGCADAILAELMTMNGALLHEWVCFHNMNGISLMYIIIKIIISKYSEKVSFRWEGI